MKLLHRYVLIQLLRNLMLCLMVVVFLFLVFDFFDRIDNILAENPPVWTTISYFLYKIPQTLTLMLPVSMMAAILLTLGIMSRNSEVTAMRASGATVRWICAPVFIVGMTLSLLSIVLNETLVPYSQRRSREIYNIDIRQKDKRGGYSQNDFWWRTKDKFFSIGTFDSRDNTMHDVSIFELNGAFNVKKRTDAEKITWVDPLLGWNLWRITEYLFDDKGEMEIRKARSLPLWLKEKPADFYDVRADPSTMSFRQLNAFINGQAHNGLRVTGLMAYLYEKISFPFVNLIVSLVVVPFALKPARSGSMAASVVAALVIGFSYFAVHSFSIALGRAELLPPLLSAWAANIIMGFIGVVLISGTEAP